MIELLTEPTKAQCAAVNLSPPTHHLSPHCPAPPPPLPPPTHTSHLYSFLFHSEAGESWGCMGLGSYSETVNWRLALWERIQYSENLWQAMVKGTCCGDQALRSVTGWASLRFITTSCWIWRESSSHAPQLSVNTANPLFTHAWKSVFVSVRLKLAAPTVHYPSYPILSSLHLRSFSS